MDFNKQYYRVFAGEANIRSDERMLIVNCSGLVSRKGGFSNNNVRRDFYLMYVTEGEINITFGEKCGTLKKGSLLIMSPETRYAYRACPGEKTEYSWVHFTGSDAERILVSLGIAVNEILNAGVHMELKELFGRLWRCFITGGEKFSVASGAVLSCLLSAFSDYVGNSESRLIKSIEYINMHYGENIKISELAKNEKISEVSFRRIFREETGKSPSEYIAAVRINAAVLLLESTDRLMPEIAAMCGFYDEYYFGKVFKKHTGISPGAFRKNIKDKSRDFR